MRLLLLSLLLLAGCESKVEMHLQVGADSTTYADSLSFGGSNGILIENAEASLEVPADTVIDTIYVPFKKQVSPRKLISIDTCLDNVISDERVEIVGPLNRVEQLDSMSNGVTRWSLNAPRYSNDTYAIQYYDPYPACGCPCEYGDEWKKVIVRRKMPNSVTLDSIFYVVTHYENIEDTIVVYDTTVTEKVVDYGTGSFTPLHIIP